MKKVLEDLFFGEIHPHMETYNSSDRAQRNLQIIEENEDLLLKMLDNKARDLLIDLLSAKCELDGDDAVGHFIYGFQLGANIIMESMMDDN